MRRAPGERHEPPAGRSRTLRRLALTLLAVSFAGGVWTSQRVVELDRIVVARFEGRRFRVPSRVYSAPAILYPGLDTEQGGLRQAFDRLGYRSEPAGRSPAPGGYVWGQGRVRVHLRAFEHPTRPEPSRDIELRLAAGRIDSIREAASGRELGAVLLEPEPVGSYYGLDREQRELVRLEHVPPSLVAAILAVEDQRFEEHPGIDWRRIAGAFWVNLRSGSIRQGGSTLTQQLVKNFFLTPARTVQRKLQEAVMALLVEARYEKPAILESYLNEIYLGQRGATAIHGVGEAARFYFGKPVGKLGVAESALLAAIISSPGASSPFRNPERARERRDLVLQLMHRQGRIDDASFVAARGEPLVLASRTREPQEARYFLDALRRQLPEVYDAEALTSEGLRIYSTLDVRLQQLANRALREGLDALEKRHPTLRAEKPSRRLQGCLVALRPQTGEVVALVGGRDYSVSQFDRCTQARRPAGSVFKPIVYVTALEPRSDGPPTVTLASRLDDGPLTVRTPVGDWTPANYDHEFHGTVSVRQAVESSLNVATARLGQQVGIARIVQMARRLGIESPLPEVPSLAIGSADLTPIELARAYATLANGGVRPEIRTFEDAVDAERGTLERRTIAFQRVLDPGVAYLAASLLEGVVDRGTARAVRAAGLTGPVAAKTGTSDEERDAWFVGFTPELVAAVWVGFDEPRSLRLPASQVALPIWLRFAKEATGGRVRGAFVPPPNVARADVDPQTGALALRGCPEREAEFFVRGTEPIETCPEGGAFAHDGDQGPLGPGGLIDRLFDRWLRDVL